MDKAAYESDGVMLVGRVKWHTDFAGKIESGLFKMMAIGLGKFAGAQRYHTYAYRLGLEHVIRSIGPAGAEVRQDPGRPGDSGRCAITTPASSTPFRSRSMEQREEENLALVKSWMARIPVDLDILILDEIGKNISGAGMDTKVVNRGVQGEYNPWPDAPQVPAHFRARPERADLQQRGRARDGGRRHRPAGESHRLDADDHQLADRQHAGGDPHAVHFRHRPRVPGAASCRRSANSILSEVTIGWIRNTMELGRLAISENMRAQLEKNPHARNRIDHRLRVRRRRQPAQPVRADRRDGRSALAFNAGTRF